MAGPGAGPALSTVAVVGGGWAGLACAVEATQAGHAVTLFEAARTWGGRARALDARLPDGQAVVLDNGQHILIGAYSETLALMRRVGIDVDATLARVPLVLRFPDGRGLALPRLPAWLDRATRRIVPMDVLAGILGARGWSWRDKLSLLATANQWRHEAFTCAGTATVADICARLTPRVRAELTEPLCVSALNTPAERASGTVFLRVLRDALFDDPGGSQLLLPRVDLGTLFPDAAGRWLGQHGAKALPGRRVLAIAREGERWRIAESAFDRVVLACPPWEAARLTADISPAWSAMAKALPHEAIATVFVQGERPLRGPLLALRSCENAPAQFVLDRGQLGGPRNLLAFVVSASTGDRETIERLVLAQAREELKLAQPRAILTVVERRATFACQPMLPRPPMQLEPGLVACGDYVDGPYPATLEGAVRSALAAAATL